MVTIGDANPELAKKLGLDTYQAQQLAAEMNRWDGAVLACTFRDPPPRADGKRDPIAYLPPSYSTYAIVDRDHRTRVQAGESWVCEVQGKGGAQFLIPLFRLNAQVFFDLRPNLLQQAAEAIARNDSTLAKTIAEKLPKVSSAALEAEVHVIKEQNLTLAKRLQEVERERNASAAELEELKAKASSVPSPAPPVPSRIQAPAAHPAKSGPVAAESETAGTVRRVQGDVVESRIFVHAGYEVHFTPDLTRVVAKPSRTGTPCQGGRLHVTGLTRIDPSPAPRDYPVLWDDRQGGFVMFLDRKA